MTNTQDIIIDELSRHFNILHWAHRIPEYPEQVKQYEHMLANTRKDPFDDRDRYVVIHWDTDYFLPGVPYGLCMHNLIRSFQYADIDLKRLVMVTTDLGGAENLLCQIRPLAHSDSLPTVINIAGNGGPYPHTKGINELDVSSIEKHAVCLMRMERVHRNVCYHRIEQAGIKDRIVIRYR